MRQAQQTAASGQLAFGAEVTGPQVRRVKARVRAYDEEQAAAEHLRCVQALDRKKRAGRPRNGERKLASAEANSSRSAEQTAAVVGVSKATVERARAVIEHAPEEAPAGEAQGTVSATRYTLCTRCGKPRSTDAKAKCGWCRA